MNVSDISVKTSVVPGVEKTAGAVEPRTIATPGNTLPVIGNTSTHPEHSHIKITPSQADAEKLSGLVDQANKDLAKHSSTLKFSVVDGTGIRVIRIEDSETGQLIRQIPSEQMVAIAKALKEVKQGVMLEDLA